MARGRIALLLALLAGSCAAGSCAAGGRVGAEGESGDRIQAELAAAQARHARDPADEDAIVWLGRRLGYAGRYAEAVDVFSRGLELHPESVWLLRFRGHRYITLRRFDDAVRDLERADELAALGPDEVEPDGQPNPSGIPTTTLRSNIDYHLGLALYLRGDLEGALEVYRRGAERAAANADRAVSHGYWHWLTLRRLGRDGEARAHLAALDLDAPLLENEGYRALLRHFRGELSEADLLSGLEPGTVEHATRAYGAAIQRHLAGDAPGALERLRSLVAAGPSAAFGTIAAEADLPRLATPAAR